MMSLESETVVLLFLSQKNGLLIMQISAKQHAVISNSNCTQKMLYKL